MPCVHHFSSGDLCTMSYFASGQMALWAFVSDARWRGTVCATDSVSDRIILN